VNIVNHNTTILVEETTLTNCVCSCECGNQVTVPTFSPVLQNHARCQQCTTVDHLRNNPRKTSNIYTKMMPPISATPLTRLTVEEERYAVEAQQEIREELLGLAQERWKQSLPEKFRNAHSVRPEVLSILNRLEKSKNQRTGRLDSEVASLVLVGERGRGKTWIAAGYANDAIQRKLFHPSEVLFGTETELLSSAANATFGEVEKQFAKFSSGKIKLLIIDDVGRGTWLRNDMRTKVFWHVINEQYKRNNIILITTNLESNIFKEYVGPAAYDRLISMTGKTSIKLVTVDEDYRSSVTTAAIKRTQN